MHAAGGLHIERLVVGVLLLRLVCSGWQLAWCARCIARKRQKWCNLGGTGAAKGAPALVTACAQYYCMH